MTLLARDFGRRLYGSVALVSGALIALFAFFDLIEHLDAGTDRTLGIWRVLGLTVLEVPSHLYELFPVAVLIGALLVMAQIAASSEYTVIRTSGVSVGGIVRLLARPALVLIALAYLTGEWLVPLTDRVAVGFRSVEENVVAQRLRSGFWLKDGRNFVNLSAMSPDGRMSDPLIYRFGKDGALEMMLRAQSAHVSGGDAWVLDQVEQTTFARGTVQLQKMPRLRWQTSLGPEILQVLAIEPDRMSVLELWPYIRHLRDNRQDTIRYETALWSKLLSPLSLAVMLVLALPFARMQVRSGGLVARVFVGILLGVGFHFLGRVSINLGQLNAWQPVLSAGLPIVVFLVSALILLRRVERV